LFLTFVFSPWDFYSLGKKIIINLKKNNKKFLKNNNNNTNANVHGAIIMAEEPLREFTRFI